MSEWISVKDRLPETGKVLMTDGSQILIAPGTWLFKTRDGIHEVPANYGRGMVVTHWMPLPELPEVGGAE